MISSTDRKWLSHEFCTVICDLMRFSFSLYSGFTRLDELGMLIFSRAFCALKASCVVRTISLCCSWLQLMGFFLLFIQDTRSDSQSQQAQGLAQLTGQVLDTLVYSWDMTMTLWIQLFPSFSSQRLNITMSSLRQTLLTLQTWDLSLLRGEKQTNVMFNFCIFLNFW